MVFQCGEGYVFGSLQHQLQQQQQRQQQQQQQQAQQAQQLNSLCFYQNPEGTSSLGAACFWRSSFSSMVFRCGEGCVLEACSSRVRFGGLQQQHQQHHQQQQEQQQQQQAQQLNSLCFYQNPEGMSSLEAACFWTSFRPSVAWCFGVAKGALGQHGFWRSFRPSVAWCFGVAKGTFWKPAAPAPAAAAAAAAAAAGPAAEFALFFYQNPEGTSSLGAAMFLDVVPSLSSMVFRCGEGCVLEACSTSSSSTTSSSSSSGPSS